MLDRYNGVIEVLNSENQYLSRNVIQLIKENTELKSEVIQSRKEGLKSLEKREGENIGKEIERDDESIKRMYQTRNISPDRG